jgi:hypothetical protein
MDSNWDYCATILIIRNDNKMVIMLANHYHTVSFTIKVSLTGVSQYVFNLFKTESSQFRPILDVIWLNNRGHCGILYRFLFFFFIDNSVGIEIRRAQP